MTLWRGLVYDQVKITPSSKSKNALGLKISLYANANRVSTDATGQYDAPQTLSSMDIRMI